MLTATIIFVIYFFPLIQIQYGRFKYVCIIIVLNLNLLSPYLTAHYWAQWRHLLHQRDLKNVSLKHFGKSYFSRGPTVSSYQLQQDKFSNEITLFRRLTSYLNIPQYKVTSHFALSMTICQVNTKINCCSMLYILTKIAVSINMLQYLKYKQTWK